MTYTERKSEIVDGEIGFTKSEFRIENFVKNIRFV